MTNQGVGRRTLQRTGNERAIQHLRYSRNRRCNRREFTIDILELIDQIEAAVVAGRRSRFGSGWTVDREQLLDLIDRLRMAAPASADQAQRLLEERERLLKQTQEEAAVLAQQARQDAEQQISVHELVQAAESRAQSIVDQAHHSATETVTRANREAAAVRGQATTEAVSQALEADRYSMEMLRRLHDQLRSMQTSVSSALDQLELKVEQGEHSQAIDERDEAARRALSSEF